MQKITHSKHCLTCNISELLRKFSTGESSNCLINMTLRPPFCLQLHRLFELVDLLRKPTLGRAGDRVLG